MVNESYPCYVRVTEVGTEDIVELPTETDGTLLLSTITAQYPDGIGIKFKSESGAWRGVRVTQGILDAPLEGWGDGKYFITTVKAASKRKADDDCGPRSKKEMTQDLIVLGLPYSSTEDDLKEYFSTFGELAHWEIKTDRVSNKSKGFGFIRFTEANAAETVLESKHSIGGRDLEVRFPKRSGEDDTPTKLFIGRLPRGTTTEDLRDCFSDFGPLKDVYVPNNFRGFGFVTFASQSIAGEVMGKTHILKGNTLNVTHPSPRPDEKAQQNMHMQQVKQSYGFENMQGSTHGNKTQYIQGGYIQNGMHGSMQQPMSNQTSGWYGSSQSNRGNASYYSQGYFQSAGKLQNGKSV